MMPDGRRLPVTNRGRRAAQRLGANHRSACCRQPRTSAVQQEMAARGGGQKSEDWWPTCLMVRSAVTRQQSSGVHSRPKARCSLANMRVVFTYRPRNFVVDLGSGAIP
jgi:hypothetical protein